jgi:hypothetical protein
MKLGWKVLLPASLGNILVTGVVYLAVQRGGPGVTDALAVAGDVTMAIVAVVITFLVVRGAIGFFSPVRTKHKWIVGTAAQLAARAGGTKSSPMQA